jgi:hypothetical protein
MQTLFGSKFLLMLADAEALALLELPTNVPLPPHPTETEDQRRALLHSKVLGNFGLVQRIVSFIPDEEPEVWGVDDFANIPSCEQARPFSFWTGGSYGSPDYGPNPFDSDSDNDSVAPVVSDEDDDDDDELMATARDDDEVSCVEYLVGLWQDENTR